MSAKTNTSNNILLSVRWKDNGLFIGILGCILIALIFTGEIYVQQLPTENESQTVDVTINEETDNDEDLDVAIALSAQEIQQVRSISRQLVDESEQGAIINWNALVNTFPHASAGLWLEVANQLCKRRHFDNCRIIYEQLSRDESSLANDANQEALFQLAKLSTRQNKDDVAIQHYRRLLDINPNHQASLINMALALARQDRHREAISVAERAIDTSSGTRKAKAYSIKASSLLTLGDSTDAEVAFQQSIQYRPRHAPTWRKLAEAMMANEREPSKILTTLERAISLRPNYELALHDRARFYWKIGDLSKARKDLEDCRRLVPDYLPARWTLAHLYIALNKNRSAQKELNALRKLENNGADREFGNAIGKLINNNESEAFNTLSQLSENSDNSWVAYYLAVATSHETRGAAMTQLRNLFDDYWLREISQLKAAEILWQQKDYQQAVDLLSALHNAYPNSALYADYLGDLYLDFGKPVLAIPVLQRAIAATEDDRQSRFRLARAYSNSQQYEQAIASYLSYLQDYPNNKTAHYNLALVYSDVGRTEEAIEQYRQAITIDPDYTNARYNLHLLLLDRQRFTEALALLDDILAANPTHHKAREQRVAVLQRQQQWQAAMEEVERLLVLAPQSLSAKLLKSDLLRDQNQLQAAADIIFNFNDDEIRNEADTKLYNLGVRALKADDLPLAERCNKKVLSIDATNHKALVNLTEAYNRGNKFAQTIAAVEQHRALLEENHKIVINLATAHYHLGNHRMTAQLLQPLATEHALSEDAEKLFRDSQKLAVANELN